VILPPLVFPGLWLSRLSKAFYLLAVGDIVFERKKNVHEQTETVQNDIEIKI
jgi:hypothetical protein